MQAIVSHGPNQFRLEDCPVPDPDEEDVLVAVEFCGICGTDVHMYHGTWELNPGRTPGHETSGIVHKTGSRANRFAPGERVAIDPGITCQVCEYCRSSRLHLCKNRVGMYHYTRGGFAEFTAVPERQVYRLPDGVSTEWGAFLEPAGCCVHSIDRAGIRAGESASILGGGAIGLMLMQLALLAGAVPVIVSEPQEARRRLAERLGATATVDPAKDDAVKAVRELSGGGVDVVFESAGLPVTVSQCFEMVKRGGRIVLFGVNDPATRVQFSPYQVFRNEITILGSLMTNDVFPRTLSLIGSRRLRIEPLISHILPLSRFHEGLRMHEGQEGIKILVTPRNG